MIIQKLKLCKFIFSMLGKAKSVYLYFKLEWLLVLSMCLLSMSYPHATQRDKKQRKPKTATTFSEVEHKHNNPVSSPDYAFKSTQFDVFTHTGRTSDISLVATLLLK